MVKFYKHGVLVYACVFLYVSVQYSCRGGELIMIMIKLKLNHDMSLAQGK